MAIKKFYILAFFCMAYTGLHAQIGKRILNRTKNNAEYKINKKIDEKVDKTVDKGVNELDTLLTGKKSKEQEPAKPPVESQPSTPKTANTPSDVNPPAENSVTQLPTPNRYAQQMNTEWVTDIIFTNIKCDKGKRAVEKKLTSIKGVKSVSINITNGELSISYFASEIAYHTIIHTINQLYFMADGKAPSGNKDGCQ